MSKAVLISIHPKWVELIANDQKTIEIRKTRPQIPTPFKCYIYETRGYERVGNDNLNCVVGGNGRGMIIGEFVCDYITEYKYGHSFDNEHVCISLKACARVTAKEVFDYAGGKAVYGWHISALKIYDKPKELSEFIRPCCERVSDCGTCRKFGREGFSCKRNNTVVRPPQSYMYVEELTE